MGDYSGDPYHELSTEEKVPVSWQMGQKSLLKAGGVAARAAAGEKTGDYPI